MALADRGDYHRPSTTPDFLAGGYKMAAADHLPLITNSPLDSVRVHAPRINTHIFRMQNKYFINTNMCQN